MRAQGAHLRAAGKRSEGASGDVGSATAVGCSGWTLRLEGAQELVERSCLLTESKYDRPATPARLLLASGDCRCYSCTRGIASAAANEKRPARGPSAHRPVPPGKPLARAKGPAGDGPAGACSPVRRSPRANILGLTY